MNIFLTLDYELYLGDKTGSPDNCMIRPMNALLDLASKMGVKYVIFVDAAYIFRLSQLCKRNRILLSHYDKIINNIRKCVNEGHDVQLHIHPQWMYSEWDAKNESWVMDKSHYKLSDLSLPEAKDLIINSKNLLDEIVGYKTYSFRAGGFCLDNFSDYKFLFKDLGLLIDSSVAREQYVLSNIHFYDYRKIPTKQIYRFSNSIVTEDSKGEFTELSISSFSCSSFYFLTKVRKKRFAYNPSVIYQDGESISDGKNLFFDRIGKLFKKYSTYCGIDSAGSCYLDDYYNHLQLRGYKEMILIGHPKNATDASINNLYNFIKKHSRDNFLTTKDLAIIR